MDEVFVVHSFHGYFLFVLLLGRFFWDVVALFFVLLLRRFFGASSKGLPVSGLKVGLWGPCPRQ